MQVEYLNCEHYYYEIENMFFVKVGNNQQLEFPQSYTGVPTDNTQSKTVIV